jgi:xanthine dehydrogenase small subunit
MASLQIRNVATLAGNIANASPIADSITFLLAAGAEITLYSTSTGQKRKMALREFFISYKKTAIKDDEIIYSVHIPSDGDIKYSFEKSSKRFSVDIATVNSALGIKVSGGKIVSLSFSVGGVAPVPLYCEELEKEARGMPLTVESMNKLAGMAYNKIKPISDIRGTGEYRKILVKNHLIKHFYKLFPEIF